MRRFEPGDLCVVRRPPLQWDCNHNYVTVLRSYDRFVVLKALGDPGEHDQIHGYFVLTSHGCLIICYTSDDVIQEYEEWKKEHQLLREALERLIEAKASEKSTQPPKTT